MHHGKNADEAQVDQLSRRFLMEAQDAQGLWKQSQEGQGCLLLSLYPLTSIPIMCLSCDCQVAVDDQVTSGWIEVM
jgi:hypothetical protein